MKLSGREEGFWFFNERDAFADDFKGLALASLHRTLHRHHASGHYFNGSSDSLENSHNGIHVAIGGVMGQMYSAFHPIFWLHHNNVDRLYESYLQHWFPASPDSPLTRAQQAKEEMRAFQEQPTAQANVGPARREDRATDTPQLLPGEGVADVGFPEVCADMERGGIFMEPSQEPQ